MPYIYAEAEALVGKPVIGNKQCVALVREFAGAPASSLWGGGKTIVRGTFTMRVGTAIATFVNGKYSSLRTGNHAALYLGQDGGGIWVVDQWRRVDHIQKRYLKFKGKDAKGRYIDPRNNGDAFTVIER
jgi:hypothetical protein